MKKYDCIIGVDPGTKTGFAVWLPEQKRLHMVETFGILDAIEWVKKFGCHYDNILVRIENPNLRKQFGDTGRERLQGAGSIKRDFAIWKEFLEGCNMEYQEIAPNQLKTKVKPDYFKKLTTWKARTSTHSRDAAMMVYGYQ